MQPKVICGSFFLLFGLFVTARTLSAQTAITNVTIIDVRDGSTQHNMSVLISEDRISVIGSSKRVQLPKQTRVMDGRGKFLIPGLWDMHVHTDGDDRALRLHSSCTVGPKNGHVELE